MDSNFIYENDNKDLHLNPDPIKDIGAQKLTEQKDKVEDEFIKELPEWDLEPPYEPVRRVTRK